MSDTPRTTARARSGVASKEARTARARAWRFVFSCHQAKKEGAPEDTKGSENEKERGGRHVEHLTNSSSKVDDSERGYK